MSGTDLAVQSLSEQKAKSVLKDRGLRMRVVTRDGCKQQVTQDYDPKRVNVEVDNGVVVNVVGRG